MSASIYFPPVSISRMNDNELIDLYRQTDYDLAMFSDMLSSARRYETEIFVPDAANRSYLEATLNILKSRIEALPAPDSVYALLKSHFIDFCDSRARLLKSLYDRPYKHVDLFVYTFNDMSRKDSRPDSIKAKIIRERFIQADNVWNGIKSWLSSVPPLFLREFADNCKIFINTTAYHIPLLSKYFPALSDTELQTLKDSMNELSVKMKHWSEYALSLLPSDAYVSAATDDDDTVKFDEDYYCLMLSDELGVNLYELLSWYEDEISMCKNNLFETAGRIRLLSTMPRNIKDINAALLKYAGPCETPEEMFRRASDYMARSKKACRDYVWLPDDEICDVKPVPEQLKEINPWGGYGGGCPIGRPLRGEMFLNNYNYRAVTDGWIKINAVHEAYPGHHVQFVRTTLDTIPETVKLGAKSTPITEGTAHRSERVFEFIYEDDPFYPLFVSYRRLHTAVRIKADLMLRYLGRPIGEVVKLYEDELDFDRITARGQVRAQEAMQGYFTCYYYGLKKILDWEKQYGYNAKEYTELLFSAGRISLENLESFLKLSADDKKRYLTCFASKIQFE